MEEKKIRVFHTHIEVSPYEQGENEAIERQLSVWVDAEYRYDPIGYYIHNSTLYIPRGFNTYTLEKEFRSTAFVVRTPDKFDTTRGFKITAPPKNKIQIESIDFLSSEGQFKNALTYSQQALILDTGDGKTYATTHAIMNLKMKACIITHQDKIKQQWINTFLNLTNTKEDDIVSISSSNVMDRIMAGKIKGCFYFVNHQTLNSYAKANGWDSIREFFKRIAVGIKVYDEAHLAFKNVLRVDMFSNTAKTFYLTANFGRSDTKEAVLFKKCFASVYKFGEETKNYEEKRRHIIYVPVLYRSNPDFNQSQVVMNSYGFSVLGFSKYALHGDEEKKQLSVFLHILNIASKYEGKILITVPKIDDTYFIRDIIKNEPCMKGRTISTINSKHSKEENNEAKQSDIICSTIKSCGTGVDIGGLRCIINLEPFSSQITANQLAGRLREYAKDKDTYFFDLIDTAFPSCERQYKTKLSYLKKKCKEIQVFKYDEMRKKKAT